MKIGFQVSTNAVRVWNKELLTSGYRNQGLIKTANESRYLKKNKQNIVDPSNAGKSEMYKVTEWCDSPVEKQTGSDVNTDTLLVVWLAARLTELKS